MDYYSTKELITGTTEYGLDIRPCPFCGSGCELIVRGNANTKSRSAEIKCLGNCNLVMKVGAIRFSTDWCIEKVVKQWNVRI